MEILTLDKCRKFFNDSLENDDYEILAILCNVPISTIKRYIKEGNPESSFGNIVSSRIVVHSIDIIRQKINSKHNLLDNVLAGHFLPDLTK